ncbi:MAG: hypothetical protein JOY61_25445 [Chloroflexi bacterium]|nr:hypothetical protein [Chloroflexota bacterium]
MQPVALVAVLVILVALLYLQRRGRTPPVVVDEFEPALFLRTTDPDAHVLPKVIRFRARGKLRLGYKPAFMDDHVGHAEFRALPAVDIRGDQTSVRELSRQAACIWRDPTSGGFYVQLGWPGPGEPIRPRTQTRVLRSGRPHDAASQPFRLIHGDVLRLSSQVEYVFREVEAQRDRPTPEQKKIEAFESSAPGVAGPVSGSMKLSLLGQSQRREDDDGA